jgi:hypothetical protein
MKRIQTRIPRNTPEKSPSPLLRFGLCYLFKNEAGSFNQNLKKIQYRLKRAATLLFTKYFASLLNGRVTGKKIALLDRSKSVHS